MRARIAALLALSAVPAILSGGCREDVTLGGDYALVTCQAQACGAPCTIDACPASAPGCGAAPLTGVCDEGGACVTGTPPCALPPPCQGRPCGAPCDPPPMSPPGMYACTPKGTCEPGAPVCAPPDPCHGLHCGELCTPMCDPQVDGGCPPPPMPMACDMTGKCSPAGMVGCMGMPPYLPCAGKKCSDPCTLCDPMDPMCMETPMPKACDAAGTCTPGMVACP